MKRLSNLHEQLQVQLTDILRKSITYRASTLWNNLNDSTTTVSDINSFKKLVKEQLKFFAFSPNYEKSYDFIYF